MVHNIEVKKSFYIVSTNIPGRTNTASLQETSGGVSQQAYADLTERLKASEEYSQLAYKANQEAEAQKTLYMQQLQQWDQYRIDTESKHAQDLSALQQQIQEWEAKYREFELKKYKDLQLQVEKLTHENEESQDMITKLQREKATLEKEKDQVLAEKNENLVDVLKTQFESERDEFLKEQMRAQACKEEIEEQFELEKRKKLEVESERTELEIKLQRLQAENNTLVAKNEEHVQSFLALEQDKKELDATLERQLREEKERIINEKQTIAEELSRVQTELDNTQSQLSHLQAERDQLKVALTNTAEGKDGNAETMRQMQLSHQVEQERVNEEKTQLLHQREQLQAEIHSLRDQIESEKRQDHGQSSTALALAQQEKQQIIQEKMALENELQRVKEDANRSRARHSSGEEADQKVVTDHDSLREELKAQEEENLKLRNAAKMLVQENDQLKETKVCNKYHLDMSYGVLHSRGMPLIPLDKTTYMYEDQRSTPPPPRPKRLAQENAA